MEKESLTPSLHLATEREEYWTVLERLDDLGGATAWGWFMKETRDEQQLDGVFQRCALPSDFMEPAGMEPVQCHRFCPRCGRDGLIRPRATVIECPACHLVLYFNPAVAVAALICNRVGQIMFIRRAKEPSRGKLAFPGGFIDVNERAEDALIREVREEVNIPIREVAFLCSQTNRYFYKEITYPVVDLFFTAKADQAGEVGSPVEVDSVLWLDPVSVNPEDLAFSSMRATWAVFMRGRA